MFTLLLSALLLIGTPNGHALQASGTADDGRDVFTEACLAASTPEAAPDDAPFPGMFPGVQNARVFDAVRCEVRAGNVTELTFLDDGTSIAVLGNGARISFRMPAGRGAAFAAEAAELGVTTHAANPVSITDDGKEARSGTTSPLGVVTLVVVVVLGVVSAGWWWRKRRRGVGVGVVLGAASRRAHGSDVPETRFHDVAGCREAIEDLREIVSCLQDPDRYREIGARTPRGALLVGPPGTGKTLLARAVAGESGVPFYPVAGSDFVEMYVGVGAKRVRDVFQKARKQERAIVFIDEIDAVGRRRSEHVASGGEQEMENTLIALLNELDGFRQTGVVVLAATNRPDVLDPALLRPGRLDRRVHVGLPDVAERRLILDVHVRGKRLGDHVDLDAVARLGAGMSGAQLEQVCNEAALLAARSGHRSIDTAHFNEAIEYVTAGRPRRSATVADEDRRVAAWHEAGHVVTAFRTDGANKPVRASIVPRGNAGGLTWLEADENAITTRRALLARLVVALGGRAAEEHLLQGEYTAGAADDLSRASEIARTMVDRLGMSGRGLSVRQDASDASEDAVEELLQHAVERARTLVAENSSFLEAVATSLLERDELSREDIERLGALHPAKLVHEAP